MAVHGIERGDAVREVEFTEQLLGGWDFVGFVRDIDVRGIPGLFNALN